MLRAAASSIASGSPSSRRQIAATAAAFAVGQGEARAARRAPARRRGATASLPAESIERRDAVGAGRGSGSTGSSCSPRTRSGARLVASTCSAGQAASSVRDELGTCGQDVLAVVEQQQRLPRAQVRGQVLERPGVRAPG